MVFSICNKHGNYGESTELYKAPESFTGSQWFVLVAALVAFATVLVPEPANALPVLARN